MATSSASNDGSKGARIFAGRYAYQKPLGRGAGGSVYLAEDLRHGRRPVALKVLSAEAYQTVQGKMLRREFEILSKLDHPNMVRVYDYGSLPDGGVFLAEEYIDGFSLQDARALLEPAALIHLTIEILQGLSYLHAMGMIHRDIKPANVMLLWLDDASARPIAKLVDFGLSSMDPRRDTLRGGTRSYMAPEVIRGEKGEQRSDLYSLGVTLYYALCGVLPFGPRTKDDPPPTDEDFRPPEPHRLNPDVPLPLSRFTMALLRQVPDVDYADAGEALQALVADTDTFEAMSAGRLANSLDISAAPVLKGYFERGILERREQEDDLIVDWLGREEHDRQGGLFVIRGPAGSGRSRLLHDVESASKLGGHLVVRTNARAGMAPFELATNLLTQAVEIVDSHDSRALERYVVPIAARNRLTALGVVTPGEDADPQVEQAWMQTAFEEAAAAVLPQRLVLFVDDLHLADVESLEFFAGWYGRQMGVQRPDMVATMQVGASLGALDGVGTVRQMTIEGVTRADVDDFFRRQMKLTAISDAWLDGVARACKGRPAYIEELCRTLIDAGILARRSADAWHIDLDELVTFPLPSGIRESFRRRMTTVGAGGRECLELLALIERPILWESLRSLLVEGGGTDENAERILQTLQWRHLTHTDFESNGRFVRLLGCELAEVVTDMISPEWRRALHRRIGQHLERACSEGAAGAAGAGGGGSGRLEGAGSGAGSGEGSSGGDPREAARHLHAGGLVDRARPLWEVAADAATRAGREGDETLDDYRRALDGQTDGRVLASIHLKLASLHLARYETDRCRAHLLEAGQYAERTALDWLMYRVFTSAASVAVTVGDIAWAREWRDRLRDCLPVMSQQAEVLAIEARFAVAHGQIEEAVRGLELCVRRARHFDTRRVLIDALTRLAHLRVLRDEVTAGGELYDEALDQAADESGAVLGAILATYGGDLRRVGRVDEAIGALVDAIDLMRRGGEPDAWIGALLELARCHAARNELAEARKRASEAAAFARRLGHGPLGRQAALLEASLRLRGRGEQRPTFEAIEALVTTIERHDDCALERAEAMILLGQAARMAGLGADGDHWSAEGAALANRLGARLLSATAGL